MKTKRFECLNVIIRCKDIYNITSSDALRIYLYIICHINERQYCYLSIDLLSHELNITKQRIISAIDLLKHDCFISVFGNYKYEHSLDMVYKLLNNTVKTISCIDNNFD